MLNCGKEVMQMYDNLEWDDVFQVWYNPADSVTEVDLSEEDLADIAERGLDHWLHSLAGIL